MKNESLHKQKVEEAVQDLKTLTEKWTFDCKVKTFSLFFEDQETLLDFIETQMLINADEKLTKKVKNKQ